MVRITRKSATVSLAVIVGCCLLANSLSKSATGELLETPATSSALPRDETIAGPGRLEPASGEIDLAADVPGVLASVPVKEGDHVKKGQVLAELVNDDTISLVDQAAATLLMQSARLDKLKKGPRIEERKQALAAMQEQDATLRRLQHDLKRQNMLFARGYASNATLEQAQSAQSAALARRSSAAEALAQMDAGPRVEDVASAQAEVVLARAQLQGARAALEKTRIRAPIDGVILRAYKHPGEAVGPGTTPAILQIGDLDHLVVRMQIDEADIARVTKGTQAYVTAAAFPGKRFKGAVTDVSPRLGAKTIQTGAPTEKRDASVLDVLVTLDAGEHLPIGLRVDCYLVQTDSAI